MSEVTRAEIASGLRRLGARAGDTAMVHGSLRSFGRVEGGADAVIDALFDVLGPGGTLVMPTMGTDRGGRFDPLRTPSTGLIPETFRRRPGVLRSAHPTHSVAASGPRAAWMIEGPGETTAVSRAGPYGRLVDVDAAYITMGTGAAPCTIFHAFEEWMRLPYLEYDGFEIRTTDPRTKKTRVRRGWLGLAGHRGFYLKDRPSKVELALREDGLLSETRVGLSRLLMFRARACAAMVLARLRTEPDLLLCDDPSCRYCTQARACMEGWTPRTEPAKLLEPATPGG